MDVVMLYAAFRNLMALGSPFQDQSRSDRASLVSAEIARIEGGDFEAIRLHERAISSAQASWFLHNETLANETPRASTQHMVSQKIADSHLREVRYCYLRSGADCRVSQLDELYSNLRKEASAPGTA